MSHDDETSRLSVTEVFGLSPLSVRLREAALTFRGDPHTPKSRFDLTSLKVLRPSLSFPLWLGRRAHGRLVPIYNLFSYVRPAAEFGWSVRVTTARDFLGTQLTYDSHNGTDFAIAPGTLVTAAAAGRVARVSSEFNRGGLKIFLDHGDGLITTYNHLARALVRVGDVVPRGGVIARSGMSGIDGFLMFPWSTPHVHFNVWLNGEYVDPFAPPGETPLFRNGNWPTPAPGNVTTAESRVPDTQWDHDAVDAAIRECAHEGVKAELLAAPTREQRAVDTLFQLNYFPTRFRERPALYRTNHPRSSRLDLPFRAADFDGIWFPHGVEPPRVVDPHRA